jgi:hypothetical protein
MSSRNIMRITFMVTAAVFILSLSACSQSPNVQGEILVGLTNQAAPLIQHRQQPDPLNTGVPSLDALNKKWQVQEMSALFPDLSPDDQTALQHGLLGMYKLVVPKKTNLQAMIRDYETDANVVYAEINQTVEIK